MSDVQFSQFNKRLKRIHRIHRRGGGFEANGTLGQSYYTRRARRAARPVLMPTLAFLATFLCIKAVAAASMPSADYLARVDALRTGTMWEQGAALVMTPDPVSRAMAGVIAPLFADGS
ncbi:MAG: hypothetical protein AAF646_16175 [Pseudomonadota bacterium]